MLFNTEKEERNQDKINYLSEIQSLKKEQFKLEMELNEEIKRLTIINEENESRIQSLVREKDEMERFL